ncbi:NADH:flavin oxidoreductase [Pontibacillus sp. HMF3514]|uniref:oxidoreductase n=1 Tax=Pontibacillus sp. HMF3514 TaxID=2692425 RepID=UPI00351B67DA
MTHINNPMSIGDLMISNRLIMAPMQQNHGSAEAYATDYHINHYTKRAGSIGLIIIESTAVSKNGRLYPDDIGIFTDKHTEPLKRIVDSVHEEKTPIFIQLSHGGRKSHPKVTEKMVAPSPIPFDDRYGTPNEITIPEIKEIIADYRNAARRNVEAGFDGIELHAAHGYLLHQFLSPLSNQRSDHYGGSVEKRSNIVLEILEAIRSEVGYQFPLQIRVSASDFTEDGLRSTEVAKILKILEQYLDAVHVSAGGLLPIKPLATPEGYQVPFAAIIKQYVNIPIITVGKIDNAKIANYILTEELADFISIGRPLLNDAEFAKKLLLGDE